MTKETLIIFVYDTSNTGSEGDSPSPVKYFYPRWVSDDQKSALCGQIVGTVDCFGKLFKKPNIVAVASGHFHIKFMGKYLFAVGTETNSTTLRLQQRAKILYSLIEFLHLNIDGFLLFGDNKLSDIENPIVQSTIDDILKLLTFSNSILLHDTSIPISKSLDGIFLDAMNTLETCRDLGRSVLGGVLLYKNNIVATQLDSHLTQILLSAHLYRLHTSAKSVDLKYNLPSGVYIFQVFIPNSDYIHLLENSEIYRKSFDRINSGESEHEKRSQDMTVINNMKRDQSLLFTAVPEDSSTAWEQPFIRITKKKRPKFLNLRTTISIGNSNELKSKVNTGTPLCNQTSICSTPLKEFKKVIHQYPLSICDNEDDGDGLSKLEAVDEVETRNNSSIVESVAKKNSESDTTNDSTTVCCKPDEFSKMFMKKVDDSKSEKPLELLDLLTRNQRQTDQGSTEYAKTPNYKLGKLISQQTSSFSKFQLKKDLMEFESTESCLFEQLSECHLLVNGMQDFSMAILMNKENSEEEGNISKMVDISTEYIEKFQRTLRHKVDNYNDSESHYSYLYLDIDSGISKRKGTWNTHELTVIGYLSEDFKDEDNDITEVLVRGSDNIILGQNVGTFNAFYNEMANFCPGLPPPIDPMGAVQVRAIKKLERDHMPVLF